MSRKPPAGPPSSEELPYRRLFDASREAVLLLDDACGQVLEANPAAAGLLGIRRERLIGRDAAGLFQPASSVALRSAMSLARCSGRGSSAGLRPLSRGTPLDGSLSMVEAGPGRSAFLLKLSRPNRPWGFSGASAVLAMLDAAARGFVVTRADGRVQYANEAFCRMVGVPAAGAVCGASLNQWLQLAGEEQRRLRGQLRGGGAVARLVTLLRDALGRSRAVEVQAVAVPGARSSYLGYVFSELPGPGPLH